LLEAHTREGYVGTIGGFDCYGELVLDQLLKVPLIQLLPYLVFSSGNLSCIRLEKDFHQYITSITPQSGFEDTHPTQFDSLIPESLATANRSPPLSFTDRQRREYLGV